MITEEAKERTRILAFWERHGTEAATEAFKISKRTLFRWQKSLKQGQGKLENLNPKSTSPKRRRKREIPENIKNEIILIRTEHPHLGKDKVWKLLAQKGYTGSISTVGRIISDLKEAGRLPNPKAVTVSGKTGRIFEKQYKKRSKKLRRPKGYRVLEVDTVVRFIDGVKRYTLTAIDTEKKISFAACYTNHGSKSAADFLRKAVRVIPDCPRAIQTDNGSEFALHFERAAQDIKLIHFHIYPRSPKMNSHIERFNRSLDEEFLIYHRSLMRDDVAKFNEKLIDWLLWYNGERPHHSLGLLSPFQGMMSSLKAGECHMWWTDTFT